MSAFCGFFHFNRVQIFNFRILFATLALLYLKINFVRMLAKENITQIVEMIEKAGNALLDVYKKQDLDIEMKADATPVTEADKLSNEMLRKDLKALFPDIPVISEEEEAAKQNKVDGIIGLTYNPDLEVDPKLPYVSIDRYFSPSVPCVSSDNFGGGQLAAEKLLELGCTRPLFLRIGSKVPGESDKRGDGFESVFRQKQMGCVSLRLSDEEGYAPFRDFLSSHMEGGRLAFDGIFCVNDALAVHVRNLLAELGLRVPEDVQIIGFDGIRQFGTGSLYCSTIIQPVRRLAETSVGLLLREDRSNLPSLVCLPVSYARAAPPGNKEARP